MKKIKLNSLVDTNSENIDDIYQSICSELNLKKDTKKTSTKEVDKLIKKASTNAKPVKKVNDADLLLSMTKRLNIVESQLKDANNKLMQKDLEIAKLKKELDSEKNSVCENCIRLNKQIDHRTQFINKLYSFLQENGIIISNSAKDPKAKAELDEKLKSLEYEVNQLNVDNFTTEKNTEDHSTAPLEEETPTEPMPSTVDIKTLERRIEEMNNLIYEESSGANFVSEDGKIFKIAHRKEISITFFKNGIVIEGYQFFPYPSKASQRILQDIIDGYSPFILKEKYPNGVIMKVVNNLHLDHEEKPMGKSIASYKDTGEKKRIPAEEFIKIFPEKVIKDGNVLNIREDMAKILKLTSPNDSGTNKEFEKTTFNLYEPEKGEDNIAKLQIKIAMVDKVMHVNAKKEMKIKELFELVQKFTNNELSKKSLTLKIKTMKDYGFILAYPFKIIKYDSNETLEQAGLFPSSSITFDTIAKYINK